MNTSALRVHPDFRIGKASMPLVEWQHWLKGNPSLVSEFHRDVAAFIEDWLSEEEYMSMSSSGSTGKPKLIRHSKRSMIQSARNTADYFSLGSNTRALLCLPVEYVAGKMMLVRAMVCGWNIDLTQPSLDPMIDIHDIFDFTAMTPVQVARSIEKVDLFDQLIIGGSAVSPDLEAMLRSKEVKAYETYGMTETLTHIAVRKLSKVEHFNHALEVLPGIRIEKDDRDCLRIRTEYLDEGLIITNDLVHIIDDQHFELLGRVDDVINSGGVKLFPEQIENKIKAYVEDEFFVFGYPDEALGMVLSIVLENDTPSNDQRINLLHQLEEVMTLKKLERPRKVFYLKSFLRTKSGKIRRKETIQSLILQQ